MKLDETHSPSLTSWVGGADTHADFPIQNLPYGIFSPAGAGPRPGVAIGPCILDLSAAASAGLLPRDCTDALQGRHLNSLFSLPPGSRLKLRRRLSELLSREVFRAALSPMLHAATDCTLHLPMMIGDYTDFYVGIYHAQNVGRQFRPDCPLLPNYKFLPIGYHGRASSIRPSGVPVLRPSGQRKLPDSDIPSVGPSARLDYELEIGVWIGSGNAPGQPIPISEAADHIAGYCLLNDWSARDFQAWEYQPLGPFLSKNFHSTISSWVVTTEALAPFRMAQPMRLEGDPAPLPYLWDDADQAGGAFSITLEAYLTTETMRQGGYEPYRLSSGPASSMYWTVAQMVAHHTINGCNLNAGDLLGTGTISAPSRDGFGSLLELTAGGQEKIPLPTGEGRGFLEDGDEIRLTATASALGYRSIGFGDCHARVVAAP